MSELSGVEKKILFIAPLPPPVHGSAMVSEQIKNSKLIRDAFDCDFINMSTSRNMGEIQHFSIQKIFRLIGIYFQVFWHLLSRHYDLCYCAIACFGVPFLKDAPIILLCKLFRQKIVIHQHNKGMSNYCGKKLYKPIYKLVYGKCTVILLSWHLYNDVSQIVKREQVLICPNGIAQTNSSKELNYNHNVPHILYLSNLIPAKGCLDLLDACSLLKQKNISFVCDFVGGDSPEINADKFNQDIEKRGLKNNVIYHGCKYGRDKEAFFRQANVFILPTYYSSECFPLVLLEAMQYSLPIVTTNEGGIPDMVQDGYNGLICKQNNAADLADKIYFLIKDINQARQMGKNGYNLYREKFTERNFEQNFTECLNKAIQIHK